MNITVYRVQTAYAFGRYDHTGMRSIRKAAVHLAIANAPTLFQK